MVLQRSFTSSDSKTHNPTIILGNRIITDQLNILLIPNGFTNGSSMLVSHIGYVSVSNLSLSNTFLIPKLTLNLLSVGQLCELGLNVIITSSGCSVQDPKMGQTLGIGRKVGLLFELVNLHIPSHFSHTHQFVTLTSKVSLQTSGIHV